MRRWERQVYRPEDVSDCNHLENADDEEQEGIEVVVDDIKPVQARTDGEEATDVRAGTGAP